MRDDVIVTSSYLSGDEPFKSDRYYVQGIECPKEHGEFSYCYGLQDAWMTDKIIVNIEQDMERSDDLVDGLVNCPHPLCAYAYQVYPTALGRYIYCAVAERHRKGGPDTSWLEVGDEWAIWSSIGFCKIAPSARVKPLDRIFWQWLEHSVNRVVGTYKNAGGACLQWHIHWNEGTGIQHLHDYEKIPDHLW